MTLVSSPPFCVGTTVMRMSKYKNTSAWWGRLQYLTTDYLNLCMQRPTKFLGVLTDDADAHKLHYVRIVVNLYGLSTDATAGVVAAGLYDGGKVETSSEYCKC